MSFYSVSDSSIECNAACKCDAVKTAIPVCDDEGNAYFRYKSSWRCFPFTTVLQSLSCRLSKDGARRSNNFGELSNSTHNYSCASNTQNFTQCECAPNKIVSPNWCTDGCRSAVYIRYILDALIVLLESLHFVPITLLLIRCERNLCMRIVPLLCRSVREKLRSMALGISGVVISIGKLTMRSTSLQ